MTLKKTTTFSIILFCMLMFFIIPELFASGSGVINKHYSHDNNFLDKTVINFNETNTDIRNRHQIDNSKTEKYKSNEKESKDKDDKSDDKSNDDDKDDKSHDDSKDKKEKNKDDDSDDKDSDDENSNDDVSDDKDSKSNDDGKSDDDSSDDDEVPPTPTMEPTTEPTTEPTPTPAVNNAPTLGSIGARNVDLGNSMIFKISATDPDNDSISFIVTPIPLPDNATFNCGTGLFRFTPDITQAGFSFDLTFIASDGELKDSETVTITVNDQPLSGDTALQGQLLDANEAQQGITTPIIGAVVTNIETGISTITDTSGNFTLTGLSSGDNHFEYDASSVTAPHGSSYGAFKASKEIIEFVTNIINRPIYLMRIDSAGEVQVDPANTTVLTNPNLNVTITIPPNTLKDENGNDFNGILSISEVPVGFTPASLPDNLGPGMVISLQPMGLTFEQPVPITFPNFDNLTPGNEVNLWSLNHSTGKFFIAGTGQVSVDGTVINIISGGIRESSWHLPVSDPLENSKSPGFNETSDNTKSKCFKEAESGYVIQTGNFFEDHTLPSYRSLGISRGLKFIYNSTSAFPCPIITTQTSLTTNNPVPNVISTNLRVGGVNLANETFKQGTSDLVRQSSMFNATNIDTGVYLYFLDTKSHYSISTVTGGNVGNVIVNNKINSPFGAGWTLNGIQKLHDLERPDGRVLLTDGSGSAELFTTKSVASGEFSKPNNFTFTFSSSIATEDFNGDNLIDIASVDWNNTLSILIGDGTGDFTSIKEFPVLISNTIATGDFNNDNLIDIVAANYFDKTVTLVLGEGQGNFGSPIIFPLTGVPIGLVTGDFNSDNQLDLATVNETGDNTAYNITVLLGDGTGGFVEQRNFNVADFPYSIAAGDFNGDTIIDLAVGTFNTDLGNIVSILQGDGIGNFLDSGKFIVGRDPYLIITADFNNDNALDIATANMSSDDVSILLGNGNGDFQAVKNFPIGNTPIGIITDNFNGDSNLDIATVNFNSRTNNTTILRGDGNGNFSAPITLASGGNATVIGTADFNGDDTIDIVTIGDQVSTFLGESSIPGGPSGDFSTMVKNSDETFTRTMKDGTEINFNANGLHTSTVDRNGNTTTYSYDLNEFLTTITDPVGLVTTLAYQNGLLSTVVDPSGRITTFQHDNKGNLTKIIAPDGSQSSYTYDTRHLMTTETDQNGNTHTINYSFAGRFESMDFADGSTRQLTPSLEKGLVDISSGVGDSLSNPAPNLLATDINSTLTDGNGNVTTTKTDNFGAITESTDNCCFGRITSIERDEDALPTKITKANGAVTTMTYDDNGNLLTSDNQSIGAVTTFTYEPTFNKVTSLTDPNGNTTTINYDVNGNPTEIIDAQGNSTIQTFNSQGLLTSVTDTLSNTTTFTYDTNGNLLTTTDPLLNTTTLATDLAGNVITTTDGNSNITQFAYDEFNRIIKITDANNSITNYIYDPNGNLTEVIDANVNVTLFAYDSLDRLIINTDPLGNSDTFMYDNNSNLINTTNRNGQTIDFQYDNLNQLVNKTLPGNLATDLNYDLTGNLTSITDPDSNLRFSYDGADRLASAATTGSPNQPDVTIDYTYDNNGNRLTMTDSLTGTTNYLYDTLNRITTITSPANQIVNFGYDALSRRINTTLPNGVTTDFAYDPNSRLTSLQHKLGLTALSDFSYTYDTVGNRTVMNTTRSGLTVNSSLNYVYDNIYQLTQATRPLPAQPDETFNYDPLGNRLQRDGETTNSTIGQANRLLDDTAYTYSYDNNGNLIQKTDKATNETTDYTYNTEDRLIRIDLPSASIAQYRYDGLGRRIGKVVDGVITRYVYDSEDILLEFNGANTQIARYTHGLSIDEPLITARGGLNLYYHTDGLGSIIDLTDTNGAVVLSYIYDSFGNIEQQIGNVVNPYTYTGREIDTETGLYYYRARYYDSIISRFINEDPIGFGGGDNNFYRYVQNDPVNFVDPSGLIIFELPEGVDPEDFDPTDLVNPLGPVASVGKKGSKFLSKICKNLLGPSGKPKIHVKKHPSLKRAKDAASARAGKGGTTEKDPTPTKGNGHFHGVKQDGTKIRIHDEFP